LIIGISDKQNKKTIIVENEIIYRLEKQFCYGVSLEFRIGVRKDKEELELNKEYTLLADGSRGGQYYLYAKLSERIGKENISVYCFVKSVYEKLLNNEIPNDYKYLGVDFKTFIKSNNNQLKYFSMGLKKKGTIVVNNEDGEPTNVHVNKALSAKVAPIEPTDIREIQGYELSRKNYYTTHADGSMDKTKNGKSKALFLPKATKEEIRGLDTYLLAKYELWGYRVSANIGDKIKIKEDDCVIMEKETFIYSRTFTTFLVAGVIS